MAQVAPSPRACAVPTAPRAGQLGAVLSQRVLLSILGFLFPLLEIAQAAAPPPILQEPDYPFGVGPDGLPALGPSPDPTALRGLLTGDSEANTQFVSRWMESVEQVTLLMGLARALYERRGYFELLDPRATREMDQELEQLHTCLESIPNAPLERLSPGRARALARLSLDPQYLLRHRICRGADEDLACVRNTLRLLAVHTHGYGGTVDPAALHQLAAQADLAAARLRCLRMDLEALYEPQSSVSSMDPEAVIALARLLEGPPGLTPRVELERALKKTRKRAEQMGRELHTTRFEGRHVALLARRRADRIRVQPMLTQLYRLMPEIRHPTAVAPGASGSEARFAAAQSLCESILALDPLGAEAHYGLALCTDFRSGQEASVPHFERYLALRGILHWEERSFAGRSLTAQEQWAAWNVNRWTPLGEGR